MTTTRESINQLGHVLNGTAPHVARVGGYLLSSTVNGRDVLDGPQVTELDAQVAAAFRKMGEVLEAAQASFEDVGLLTIHIADDDRVREAVHRHWDLAFPDGQGPATHMIVPFGGFPKGDTFLGLQFVAKPGASRKSIVVANQPRIGRFPHVVVLDDTVITSGIRGEGATPTEQIVSAYGQLVERLAAAGADETNVAYVRNYLRDRSSRPALARVFRATFGPDSSAAPAALTLVQPNLPPEVSHEISQAIAVIGSRPEGWMLPEIGRPADAIPAADIARRGNLLFSSGFDGLLGADGSREADGEAQLERLYRRMQDLLGPAGATLDNLGKVNMWINGKPAKDQGLKPWRLLFGTSEEGARDKAPARTFMVHTQPALDDDVVIEMELIGAF